MSQNNRQSSKQQQIEFHSKLKTQFLKLYNVPFIEDDFIAMARLLELSGVQRLRLDLFLKKDGKFDFKQYADFLHLSEQTIIALHTQISKLS